MNITTNAILKVIEELKHDLLEEARQLPAEEARMFEATYLRDLARTEKRVQEGVNLNHYIMVLRGSHLMARRFRQDGHTKLAYSALAFGLAYFHPELALSFENHENLKALVTGMGKCQSLWSQNPDTN